MDTKTRTLLLDFHPVYNRDYALEHWIWKFKVEQRVVQECLQDACKTMQRIKEATEQQDLSFT